jgi:hypothetical protein
VQGTTVSTVRSDDTILLTSGTESHVETTRKIVIASRAAKIDYFVQIGGTASLEIPGEPYTTAADSREWWLAYRRAGADSEAATSHIQSRFPAGPISDAVRAYRNARIALKEGRATANHHEAIKQTEDPIFHGDTFVHDLPLAARMGFMMFEGNSSFQWTFVSPPAMYLAGKRTGRYTVWIDEVPMAEKAEGDSVDGNKFEGRLLGISPADLAIAIADEGERRELVGKHWSAVSDWDDGKTHPGVVTL